VRQQLIKETLCGFRGELGLISNRSTYYPG
jgi:hypothetical protein